MGQVTPDGTGDTMTSKRLSSARLRCFRFQFIQHCESLETRLLFSGAALVDLTATPIAAEWGVAAIQAPDVWTAGYTGRDVTVAVVDTGVALAHSDLADRLWTNVDELPGNGRDDDANGFIDDAGGWDFLDADNRPDDPAGHGTHIAGTIVGAVVPPDDINAADDSNVGGAGEAIGVAPDARVMPIRVLDGNLRGANQDIAAGIRYAVDNGADVINLSIGGKANNVIRSAIEYAGEHDVLVVAAAGNDRTDTPSYPAVASNSFDNLLSAGAFRQSGERLPASNLVGSSGAVQVDAPGQNIRSTFVTARYGYQSGTSMAAPHVAGLAALLLSANPRLTAAQLRAIIVESADPPAIGSDSAGTLNAINALTLALRSASHTTEDMARPKAVEAWPSDRLTREDRLPPQQIEVTRAAHPMTANLERPRTVLLPPMLPSAASEPASVFALSDSPRSVPQRGLEIAPYELQRALRDAALLAYRADPGDIAMHWPSEDPDEPSGPGIRQERKRVTTSAAAAAVHASLRPADVAAPKAAPR